jgi:hypothetical protein
MRWRRPGLLLAAGLMAGACRAGSLELAAGKASDNLDAVRIAWQQPGSRQWRVGEAGQVVLRHAVSINHWWNDNESITALGYSPLFVYRRLESPWSLRFGIGAAFLSDTQIAGRILSSHFQFEDQLGLEWTSGRHRLGLVYLHYSNAGIEKPNHGLDLLMFSYSLRLD